MTAPVAARHLNRRRYLADLTLEFIHPPRKIVLRADAVPVPLVKERRQHDQAVLAFGCGTQDLFTSFPACLRRRRRTGQVPHERKQSLDLAASVVSAC